LSLILGELLEDSDEEENNEGKKSETVQKETELENIQTDSKTIEEMKNKYL
jgi:hypothetical protein